MRFRNFDRRARDRGRDRDAHPGAAVTSAEQTGLVRTRPRGPGGHYRLGVGARLPPLLLDDEEAVAVAVGLRAATGVAGVEETSARALAKLEQVLPDRLRRKLTALVEATTAGPANTDSNVEDPEVDAVVLETVSLAIRDHDGLRCDYRGEPTEIEPYHLVAWQRRWYLVARDPRHDAWSPYRV